MRQFYPLRIDNSPLSLINVKTVYLVSCLMILHTSNQINIVAICHHTMFCSWSRRHITNTFHIFPLEFFNIFSQFNVMEVIKCSVEDLQASIHVQPE